MNKNTTEQELKMLEQCQSSVEWNRACDKIVSARENKEYPPDWFEVVVASGFIDQVRSRWDAKAKRRVSNISFDEVCKHLADGKHEDDQGDL